jgi:RNA polymerase sigma factor (TIGR02999 family)
MPRLYYGCGRTRVGIRRKRLSPSPEHDESAQGAPASGALFASLYAELRQIAQRELHRSGGAGGLSPTTVLHEAYLKLEQRDGAGPASKSEFLAYASRVMRNLVIDLVRHRAAIKRGGGFEITSLERASPEPSASADELEALSDAIEALSTLDPELAELVDLKFFCGFSFVELAAVRAISERTLQRDWEKARILLRAALEGRDLLGE